MPPFTQLTSRASSGMRGRYSPCSKRSSSPNRGGLSELVVVSPVKLLRGEHKGLAANLAHDLFVCPQGEGWRNQVSLAAIVPTPAKQFVPPRCGNEPRTPIDVDGTLVALLPFESEAAAEQFAAQRLKSND